MWPETVLPSLVVLKELRVGASDGRRVCLVGSRRWWGGGRGPLRWRSWRLRGPRWGPNGEGGPLAGRGVLPGEGEVKALRWWRCEGPNMWPETMLPSLVVLVELRVGSVR